MTSQGQGAHQKGYLLTLMTLLSTKGMFECLCFVPSVPGVPSVWLLELGEGSVGGGALWEGRTSQPGTAVCHVAQ